ncbi:MAG: 30S ribosomal protein S17e [Candidatus Diapherotrites archaeon]
MGQLKRWKWSDLMGKAVPRIIKQRCLKLLEAYPESFSKDFAKNKAFLKGLGLPFSRTDINLMAGFITRKAAGKKE